MLAGNVMESSFQGKVLADILVDSYFCIEIGRGIGWSGGMAVSTPDEIGSETPAVWQSELRSQLEDGKIVIAGISKRCLFHWCFCPLPKVIEACGKAKDAGMPEGGGSDA